MRLKVIYAAGGGIVAFAIVVFVINSTGPHTNNNAGPTNTTASPLLISLKFLVHPLNLLSLYLLLLPSYLINLFENLLTVQFIHRCLAFIIVLLSIWLLSSSGKVNALQRKAINFLLLALSVQFLLGVLTLLSKVQITLAAFHQMGAFLLFSSCVFLLFQFRNSAKKIDII